MIPHIIGLAAGAALALGAAATTARTPGGGPAAGYGYSLWVTETGEVLAWGDGRHGQLGNGRFEIRHGPERVTGPMGKGRLEAIASVRAGMRHSLAVGKDGSLWAWGDNTFGQLGNGHWGTAARSAIPVRVVGPGGQGVLEGVVAADAGWDHSVALLRDGTVWAWGSRCQGQVGDGIRDSNLWVSHPVQVGAPSGEGGLGGVTAIACGAVHTLALLENGDVLAWGGNHEGQLGRGRGSDRMHRLRLRAVWPAAKPGVWRVSLGYLYTNPSQRATVNRVSLADDFDGPRLRVTEAETEGASVAQGGFARRGGGVAMRVRSTYPERARAGTAVEFDLPDVRVGLHSLDDDTAEAFHLLLTDEESGEVVRLDMPYDRQSPLAWPTPVVGPDGKGVFGGVRAIAAGVHHSVAARADGTAWAWGHNGAGQLGDGTRERRAQPTPLLAGRPAAPLTEVVAVAAGNEHTAVLDASGRAWVCGWNVYGQLGSGEPSDSAGGYPSARLVRESTKTGSLDPVEGLASVVSGAFHLFAARADGRMLAWGHNGYGQLADGSLMDRTTAVPAQAADAGYRPPAGRIPPHPPASAAALRMSLPDPTPGDPGVLNVHEHGATGDGTSLDQTALQGCIDKAHAAGGGTVFFPPGVYRTGTLHLRSGVRLHLAEGATLLGSTNRDHYPSGEARPGLVSAAGAERIAITGQGTIDGQGHVCPSRGWRTNVIYMENCDGVTVEGVATKNSGSWTQHYVKCTNLVIRAVTVNSVRPRRNNDGIDLSGCVDALIEGCLVASEDDAICIKSQGADRENRNIRAINNTVLTLCNGFKLGTETRGVFENIVCEDLRTYGGSSLAVWTVDGAHVRNVRIERVRAEDSRFPLGVRLGARLTYFKEGEDRVPGSIMNVVFRDVDVTMTERSYRDVLLDHGIENAEMAHQLWIRPAEAAFISGLPGFPVRDVLLENVRISHPGGGAAADAGSAVPERRASYPNAGMFGELPAWGLYVRDAEGIALRNVHLELRAPDGRPPLVNENLPEDDLRIEGLTVGESWR